MKVWNTENDRNLNNAALFKAMLTAAYPDLELCVSGHHILYRRAGHEHHEEIPSADALIFDHTIAKAVWGDCYLKVLETLALCPGEDRDRVLKHLYETRAT